MQSRLVDFLSAAIVKAWPALEPLLLAAFSRVARGLIQAAKDGTFPDRWKFLEPAFDNLAEEILKLLPAEGA